MVVKFSVPNPVEVVRYNPLFTHWPTEVVAKFKVPRLVEVVKTAIPFCVIVPEALKAVAEKSWVAVNESDDVPFNPPPVVAQ